jgi:dipeptidyl aminopeptidase/acylaminoacyl peptidase
MSAHLDLELLLQIPYIDPDLGFDISPSGSKVAFSWNLSGRWEIYILDLESNARPKKMTSGEGAKFAPRWNPDGNRLAYARDLDGGENYDIFILDLKTGEHHNLTQDTPEAILTGYAWSPDGKWIAFSSNRDGNFDTFVMPSTGGQPRKVLEQPYPDFEIFWSPDGDTLAVEVEGGGQDYWTFLVPLEDGNPYPIAIDGAAISAKDACWAPDGQSLAFASNISGQYEIGIYELTSGTISWLTKGVGEKEEPDWSLDGHLVYVTSEGPKTKLTIMDLASQTSASYQIEPGVVYSPKFTPAGEQVIFVFDNPRYPDDLWSFSLADQTFKQLTNSLPDSIDRCSIQMPEEVSYLGMDGVQVPALLYRPPNGPDLPPAVLFIHGGPNWLTQITWYPMIQHMVSRGWVVLAPNYRGSTGYGREWQLASRFDLGGVDTADVAAGAIFLRDQGIADAGKIGITGRSWGGYLTMTCLTQHPDLWSAGSAAVPFLNWFTSHKNSRVDLQHWDRENFGDPEENHQLWHDHSPFFFLDRVQAPVQLVCGAHDVRCPASESTQAYEQLKSLGKVCEYILYPDEGHSFLKVENQVKSKKEQVDFLAKYLEERPA